MLDIGSVGVNVFIFLLFFLFFFFPQWDNCARWWSLLTLVFDPVVQLLLYFLHGWALLQTCRAIAHFDWFFFSFLRKEIAISQRYGSAAQIYNYQGRETPRATQAACIWCSWIGLALLLECFSQESQVFPFCDEFVWSRLFTYWGFCLLFLFSLYFVCFGLGFSLSRGTWASQRTHLKKIVLLTSMCL